MQLHTSHTFLKTGELVFHVRLTIRGREGGRKGERENGRREGDREIGKEGGREISIHLYKYMAIVLACTIS